MTDTIYADVSEFQVPVDDSYPYPFIVIRSNDGTYRDGNFAQNYQWCVNACESGRIVGFAVYAYWRSNWGATAQTLIDMVEAQGGPHPKMAAMIDLERGGNPGGDQSTGVNGMYWQLANWLGNPLRVFGYANSGDFYTMWSVRPVGLRMVGAGYGVNPSLPGQVAHQYTDGVYSSKYKRELHNHTHERLAAKLGDSGLPLGCAPFGHCDMNSADGLAPADLAAALGLGENEMQLSDTITDAYGNSVSVGDILKWVSFHMDLTIDQLGGSGTRNNIPAQFSGWPQLNGRTVVDALAEIGAALKIPGYVAPVKPGA